MKLAIAWDIFVASVSFIGASCIWLFVAPSPPGYDRLGITLSSVMFALVGLFFAYQVVRQGRTATSWLRVAVLATQALVVIYVLRTPFFKI